MCKFNNFTYFAFVDDFGVQLEDKMLSLSYLKNSPEVLPISEIRDINFIVKTWNSKVFISETYIITFTANQFSNFL